ncbi:hypothetical protein HDE_04241 [Halotydeus destructor]|nr:hypothetical protein HDE_04241 [Halotydeus destructor]
MRVTVLDWEFHNGELGSYSAVAHHLIDGELKQLAFRVRHHVDPGQIGGDFLQLSNKDKFISRYGGFTGTWIFHQSSAMDTIEFESPMFSDKTTSVSLFSDSLEPITSITQRLGLVAINGISPGTCDAQIAVTYSVFLRFGLKLSSFQNEEELWDEFIYSRLANNKLLVAKDVHTSDYISLFPTIRRVKNRLRGSEWIYVSKLDRNLSNQIKIDADISALERILCFNSKYVMEFIDLEMAYSHFSETRVFSRTSMHSKILGLTQDRFENHIPMKIEGGTFWCCEPGRFEKVTSVDIQSMYPSIALSQNCPLWLESILTSLLGFMQTDVKNRRHYKKLANAALGLLGCQGSPLYDPVVLSSITRQGRIEISRLRDIFKQGASEILVATDGGIFICPNVANCMDIFNSSSDLKLILKGAYDHMVLVNVNCYILYTSSLDYVIKGVDPYFHQSLIRFAEMAFMRIDSSKTACECDLVDSVFESLNAAEAIETSTLASFASILYTDRSRRQIEALVKKQICAWNVKSALCSTLRALALGSKTV